MNDTNHASGVPNPQSVMGSPPQEMQHYAANMPLWADIGYGGTRHAHPHRAMSLAASPHGNG
ncbi:MAG: hypothetical protein ACKPE6_02435 [Gammaproteobacteria bacterium]